jgi:hypothetical protein
MDGRENPEKVSVDVSPFEFAAIKANRFPKEIITWKTDFVKETSRVKTRLNFKIISIVPLLTLQPLYFDKNKLIKIQTKQSLLLQPKYAVKRKYFKNPIFQRSNISKIQYFKNLIFQKSNISKIQYFSLTFFFKLK